MMDKNKLFFFMHIEITYYKILKLDPKGGGVKLENNKSVNVTKVLQIETSKMKEQSRKKTVVTIIIQCIGSSPLCSGSFMVPARMRGF